MREVRSHSGPSIESLAQNLAHVKERIARAALRSGRDPDSVQIVAVTKGFAFAVAQNAYALGLRHFGENRVQEAAEKWTERPQGVVIHMVGHLQRNKAKAAARLFDVVESVDSVSVAHELSRRLVEIGREIDVLLEVNVAGEPQKFGVDTGQAQRALREICCLEGLRVMGLMTVAPVSRDPEDVRWIFRALADLRARLQDLTGLALPVLSMGMSDDFEVAVEEGATWVRLGRVIFGPRPVG